MALPIIKVNSTGGHDTQASGAGPATALYGANGVSSANGLTVNLSTDNPDLSGVATDGSAVLFFNDTTAGNRNFAKITGVDNGTKVVTVANAFGVNLTKGWAIGGKRSAIGTTLSRKLFTNNGGAGDALAGWIIEMESGHTESIASRIDVRVAGDGTSGRFILRGASGAATRPVLTSTGGDIVPRNDYQTYQDFNWSGGFIGTSNCLVFSGLKLTGGGISNPGGLSQVIGCEFSSMSGAIGGNMMSCQVIGNYIHDITGDAIANDARDMTGYMVYGNVIYNCTGSGIVMTQNRGDAYAGMKVMQNVIDLCGADGIRYTSLGASMNSLVIMNNSISHCTAYGINLSNAGSDPIEISAYAPIILNNNTHASGTANFHLGDGTTADGTINVGDTHVDPAYTSIAGEDFTSSALSDLGYPQNLANY